MLKWQLQRESRRAHWAYLEDVVSDDMRTNPKTVLVIHQIEKAGLISDSDTQVKRRRHYQHSRHPEGTVSVVVHPRGPKQRHKYHVIYVCDLSDLPDLGPISYHWPTMINITVHERGY